MSNPRATMNSSASNNMHERCTESQPCLESVGVRLRDARNAQKISEKEAAQKLQLMVTDLRAIEADRYSATVNDDLLRSHLRDYANLLRLNPDSILAIYDRQTGTGLHRGVQRIDDMPRTNTSSFGSLVTGGLAVITVVLGFLVALLFTNVSRLESLLAEDRVSKAIDALQIRAGDVAVASVADSALPPATMAGATGAGEQGVALALAKVRNDSAAGAQPQEKPTAASAKEVDDGTPTEFAAVNRSTSGEGANVDTATMEATDDLSFRFAKDCWVEVYDANQKRLIAEVREAGSSLQLSGKSPFRILVGHSREVVLQFNNQPIDIEKIDRSYSTLFTVGRANNDPDEPVVKTIRRKVQSAPGADPLKIASGHALAQS